MSLLFLWLLTGVMSHDICKRLREFQLRPSKIPGSSGPSTQSGKYRLDWGSAASPKGAEICLTSVTVFYNGPKGPAAKQCCQGFQHTSKYPHFDNDVTPFQLVLCGNASRHIFMNFTYKRKSAFRMITVKDDLPPCHVWEDDEEDGRGWITGLTLGTLALVLIPLIAFLSIKFNILNMCSK